MLNDFNKCLKTINSCRSFEQLEVARKMANLFLIKWTGVGKSEAMLECFNELMVAKRKRFHILKEYGKTLEGNDCLCVSNEDHPTWRGKVVRFEDWNKIGQLPLPIIAKEGEGGKEYLVMGVVLPYNEGVQIMLDEMPYKERWNLVCNSYARMDDE